MNIISLLLLLKTSFVGYWFYCRNKRNIKNTYFLLKYLCYIKVCRPFYKVLKNSYSYLYARLNKSLSENNESPTQDSKKVVKYEEKYMEKYNNTNNIDSQAYTSDFLENLKNNIIIENTPLGNVLMYYDNKRETFIYFSDNSIPYRYLEVVSRKYVITYKCKSLYVNMEKELEEAKKKQKEKREEKEKKEEDEKILGCDKLVKLKNYNSSNSVSNSFNLFLSKQGEKQTQVQRQKHRSNNQNSNLSQQVANTFTNLQETKKKNEDILLKEKANRYSYEGKLANYNFLKKVDKKETDKRLALSYADFKALS
jgi:hypothetical protein